MRTSSLGHNAFIMSLFIVSQSIVSRTGSEPFLPGPLHGPYPAAHTITRKNPVLQRNLKGEQHAVRRKGDRELSFRNKSTGNRLYAFHLEMWREASRGEVSVFCLACGVPLLRDHKAILPLIEVEGKEIHLALKDRLLREVFERALKVHHKLFCLLRIDRGKEVGSHYEKYQ